MPIAHPQLYDAVYARMRDLLTAVVTRRSGGKNRVFRSGDAIAAGRAGADKYRTVFRSSTNDDYRWTGPRPKPVAGSKPAAGGVYTSLGLNDALLGEFTFYAFKTTLDQDVQRRLDGLPTMLTSGTFPVALATKRIFEYEFPDALRIADLSLSSGAGTELLRGIGSSPTVQSALKAAGYRTGRDAYLASDDHSLPRAMAQVVRDFLPGYLAIRVSSVRASAAVKMHDDEGDNIVFFGPDGSLITELTPKREIAFQPQPNGTLKDVISPL